MLSKDEVKALLDRFLRYVQMDTQSKEGSETYPSTPGQGELLSRLARELEELGVKDVIVDEHGYVMATLPSNLPPSHPAHGKVPTVGFLAHVDTYPGVSGKNVRPQVMVYQGGDIPLPGEGSQIITAKENPVLQELVGATIITSDGTTLLGADDKAGVAEIMTAVQWLQAHPDHLHGPIRIAFTPDEEIGQGTRHFNIQAFGADFAYTLDGADAGHVEDETFCADSAVVELTGYDVHPGYAFGKMVNAVRAGAAFIEALPNDALPETTKDRQGYLHPDSLEGNVSKLTIRFIVRDFTEDGLTAKEKILEAIAHQLPERFPGLKVKVSFERSYRNMKYYLDRNPQVVAHAVQAVKRAGLKPVHHPIRGGTDGARLCEMGLLTPNLFAGGQNFHSTQEWVPLPWMVKAVETVIHLVDIWVESSRA